MSPVHSAYLLSLHQTWLAALLPPVALGPILSCLMCAMLLSFTPVRGAAEFS